MKLKYYIIFTLIAIVSNYSCKQKDEVKNELLSYDYDLVRANKKRLYNIDDNTDYHIPALFPFISKVGKSYLTFQNRNQYEILFYEIDSTDCLFRLKIEREGPNGIPDFLGYYINDWDEIYITDISGTGQLVRVDTTGKVLQKITYRQTDKGRELVPTFASGNFAYTPLTIIDSKFYITQAPMPGRTIETWPVSAYVDTLNHSVVESPLFFPPLIKTEEIYTTGIGPELVFSRCFNGLEFVYSFFFQEDIIVASPDHKQIKKIPVKSKYLSKINNPQEKRPADMFMGAKRLCEAPFYGNLLYDQYREVYYRFVYPETEMEENENYIEIWKDGRKRFSVIILDKDFNIIGETLFPDYTYKSVLTFITEDGLYICDSHVKNPEFDENKLSFQCFELVKK